MRKLLTQLSILIILLVNNVYSDCDYIALIAQNGTTIAEYSDTDYFNNYTDTDDYFEFLKERSGPLPLNKDGYGIIYYDIDGHWNPTQSAYLTCSNCWYHSDEEDHEYNEAFDSIYNDIFGSQFSEPEDVSIVLGHDRLGTGANGSHPFKLIWRWNTFHFLHNGDTGIPMKNALFNFLSGITIGDESWFAVFPSNWNGVSEDVSTWIDSELLFHYFMYFIMQENGDIIHGLFRAMNQDGTGMIPYDIKSEFEYANGHHINFIITDGNSICLSKNTPSAPPVYNMSYKLFSNGFVGIKSQGNIDSDEANEVQQYSIVHIPVDGNITVFDDFRSYGSISAFEMKPFHSGWNWVGFPILNNNVVGELVSDVFHSITLQDGGYSSETILIQAYEGLIFTTEWFGLQEQWSNTVFNINSFNGYKVWLPNDYDQYTIPLSGTHISEDAVISLTAGLNWVPYFRAETHGVFQTLPENVLDVLVSVRSKDWFMSKNSDGTWKIPSNVPHGVSINGSVAPLHYGHMYELTVTEDIYLQWQSFESDDWHEVRSAKHFFYDDKADYYSLYIESIESGEIIDEVGAFLGEKCIGAEAVDGYPIGMKLYMNGSYLNDISFQVALKEDGLGKRRKSAEDFEYRIKVLPGSNNLIKSVDLKQISAKKMKNNISTDFSLVAAYPNPFNPFVEIQFYLHKDMMVDVNIYDLMGRRVATLIQGKMRAGKQSCIWAGRDINDNPVSAGIYFYQLRGDKDIINNKLILLK